MAGESLTAVLREDTSGRRAPGSDPEGGGVEREDGPSRWRAQHRPGLQVRDSLGAHSVVALTASSWRVGQDTCTQDTCLEIQSE